MSDDESMDMGVDMEDILATDEQLAGRESAWIEMFKKFKNRKDETDRETTVGRLMDLIEDCSSDDGSNSESVKSKDYEVDEPKRSLDLDNENFDVAQAGKKLKLACQHRVEDWMAKGFHNNKQLMVCGPTNSKSSSSREPDAWLTKSLLPNFVNSFSSSAFEKSSVSKVQKKEISSSSSSRHAVQQTHSETITTIVKRVLVKTSQVESSGSRNYNSPLSDEVFTPPKPKATAAPLPLVQYPDSESSSEHHSPNVRFRLPRKHSDAMRQVYEKTPFKPMKSALKKVSCDSHRRIVDCSDSDSETNSSFDALSLNAQKLCHKPHKIKKDITKSVPLKKHVSRSVADDEDCESYRTYNKDRHRHKSERSFPVKKYVSRSFGTDDENEPYQANKKDHHGPKSDQSDPMFKPINDTNPSNRVNDRNKREQLSNNSKDMPGKKSTKQKVTNKLKPLVNSNKVFEPTTQISCSSICDLKSNSQNRDELQKKETQNDKSHETKLKTRLEKPSNNSGSKKDEFTNSNAKIHIPTKKSSSAKEYPAKKSGSKTQNLSSESSKKGNTSKESKEKNRREAIKSVEAVCVDAIDLTIDEPRSPPVHVKKSSKNRPKTVSNKGAKLHKSHHTDQSYSADTDDEPVQSSSSSKAKHVEGKCLNTASNHESAAQNGLSSSNISKAKVDSNKPVKPVNKTESTDKKVSTSTNITKEKFDITKQESTSKNESSSKNKSDASNLSKEKLTRSSNELSESQDKIDDAKFTERTHRSRTRNRKNGHERKVSKRETTPSRLDDENSPPDSKKNRSGSIKNDARRVSQIAMPPPCAPPDRPKRNEKAPQKRILAARGCNTTKSYAPPSYPDSPPRRPVSSTSSSTSTYPVKNPKPNPSKPPHKPTSSPATTELTSNPANTTSSTPDISIKPVDQSTASNRSQSTTFDASTASYSTIIFSPNKNSTAREGDANFRFTTRELSERLNLTTNERERLFGRRDSLAECELPGNAVYTLVRAPVQQNFEDSDDSDTDILDYMRGLVIEQRFLK